MDMVEGYGRQRKLGASQVLEAGQTQAEGREARRGGYTLSPSGRNKPDPGAHQPVSGGPQAGIFCISMFMCYICLFQWGLATQGNRYWFSIYGNDKVSLLNNLR